MVKVVFNTQILDVEDKPLTDITVGKALGNILTGFRPQPDAQRGGVETEHYDASRAVELGRKIYKAGIAQDIESATVELSKSDINFILNGVISKTPLNSPLIEDAVLSTLKTALNNA